MTNFYLALYKSQKEYKFNSFDELNSNIVEFLIKELDTDNSQAFLFDGTGAICYFTATKNINQQKNCLSIIFQKDGLFLLENHLMKIKDTPYFKKEETTKYGNQKLTFCLLDL